MLRKSMMHAFLVLGLGLALAGATCTTQDPGPGLSTTSAASGPGGTQAPSRCEAPLVWRESATCPNREEAKFSEFPAGCYFPCEAADSLCSPGTRCSLVEHNPCLPNPIGATAATQCGSCAAGAKLCLPILAGSACEQLIGTYWTEHELECGLTQTGVARCHWSIVFGANGVYDWHFSDTGQSGRFICHEGQIFVDESLPIGGSGPNQTNKVKYDPVTQTVYWEGVPYIKGTAPS